MKNINTRKVDPGLYARLKDEAARKGKEFGKFCEEMLELGLGVSGSTEEGCVALRPDALECKVEPGGGGEVMAGVVAPEFNAFRALHEAGVELSESHGSTSDVVIEQRHVDLRVQPIEKIVTHEVTVIDADANPETVERERRK